MMKNNKKKYTAMFMAGCMAFSVAAPVFAASEKQVNQKKTAIENQMYSNSLQIQSLAKQRDQVMAAIKDLDKKAATAQEELNTLNQQIENKTEEIQKTDAELGEAKEEEADQYEDMKKRIQYLYESGSSSMVSVILESRSITEILSRTENFQQMTTYDRQKLKEYKEVCQTIEALEKALKKEKSDLEGYKVSAEQEKANIENSIAKKQKEITAFEASIDMVSAAQADLQGELAVQNQLLQQLRAQVSLNAGRQPASGGSYLTGGGGKGQSVQSGGGQTNVVQGNSGSGTQSGGSQSSGGSYTGGFVWPCPDAYGVTSDFGLRDQPTAGASTNHKGVDMGAAGGSSIVAAAGGTVINASYSESAGNYVTIDHGNGVQTVYMHASSLNVKPGQTVSAGQQIASVGSTGYSTGNHLHFGVMSNGNYVNPMDYYK